MYKGQQYGNIFLAIFNGDVTSTQIESFAADIQTITEKESEVFLIALPINVASFPTGLSSILQSLSSFKSATEKVYRFYGIRYSPIMTFIANLATQVLKIKTNTVEAKTIEEMFTIMEKEAVLYPKLKASINYLPEIKEQINQISNAPI